MTSATDPRASGRPAAVIVADLTASIVGWDQGAQELFGWSREEALGENGIALLVDPSSIARASDALARLVRGAPWAGLLPLRTRDGSVFDAEVVARPVYLSADEVAAIVALARPTSPDTPIGPDFGYVPTLHEEERTRLALRSSGLGTWSWDARTGDVYWDETMEAIYGFGPGGFAGTYESYLEAIHPEDRDAVVETVERSLETKGEHRVEHRVVWRDGSVHWVEGWGRVLLDGAGEAIGLVGVSVDITSRRRSQVRLAQLQQVTMALSRARTIAEVGSVAIEELLVATDAIVSSLMLVDDAVKRIRVVSTSLDDAELPPEWREFDLDSTYTASEAVASGRMVVRPVADAMGPSAVLAMLRGAGEATMIMALPLKASDRTLGAIGLALTSFDPTDEDMRTYLETLGEQLGQALERAILHENEMEAAARLRLLSDASSLLGQSLDYHQTIGQVALAAVPGFADWCIVDLLDDNEELQLLAVAHADPAKVELARQLRERYPRDAYASGTTGTVARTGQSSLLRTVPDELIEDAATQHAELGELIRELRLTSAMSVPLRARGRVLGVMSFAWGESGRHYDDEDLAFAEELAGRAAIAIDNALLYEEQRSVASTLQESLRPPRLAQIAGLDLAAAFRPGGVHGEVAGDFYDVFPLRGRSWLAVIGDVCGKGVEAAAVMALARYTIRTAALTRSKPSTILATLNEALLRSELERFCTACIVRLDAPEPGAPMRVTLASAAHPPPVLLGAESAALIETEGSLLGVFDDVGSVDHVLALDPGATLVLYTDGVTEERERGELFGERRLLDLLDTLAEESASRIASGVIEAVQAFRPDPPLDDIAVLALRNPPRS